MSKYITTEIVSNGKTLVLFTVALQTDNASRHIAAVVEEAFGKLSEYMQEDNQVLYIRDMPEFCIDGKYPGGYCGNPCEAMIAIPSWRNLDMKQLTIAVYQELFHMARLQNAGYSRNLGNEIFNQGAAAYFAQLMSGWEPPCAKVEVTKKMRRAAIHRWDLNYYNYSKWFYEGKWGKWVGVAIGYEVAKAIHPRGIKLELKQAISTDASWQKSLVKDFNRSWGV